MALRKASAYSKIPTVPFTRVSKRRQKSFIKTVPPQKIVKFEMGKISEYKKGKFKHILTVFSKEAVQIRHNAFEACRQHINKKIDLDTNGQYMFKVVPYPHHIQREHKMLTGAGADRMSSGMQLSFGKTTGKAALLKKGEKVFVIALSTEKAVAYARKVIKQVNSKLPMKIGVQYEKLE